MKSKLDIFDKHRKKIAIATLKMTDIGAAMMGGMTKQEARGFLRSIGYSWKHISNIEK